MPTIAPKPTRFACGPHAYARYSPVGRCWQWYLLPSGVALVEDFYRRYPKPIKLAYRVCGRLARWAVRTYGQEAVETALSLAVVKAARRFDPARGTSFDTALGYSIINELNALNRANDAIRGGEVRPDHLEHTWSNLADTRADDPARSFERSAAIAELTGWLTRLDARSREIIERRFGLRPGHKIREIATDWNLSRERVRQIERKALEQLRRLAEGKEPLVTRPPETRPEPAPVPTCGHCQAEGVELRGRGLCRRCFEDEPIRSLYPSRGGWGKRKKEVTA